MGNFSQDKMWTKYFPNRIWMQFLPLFKVLWGCLSMDTIYDVQLSGWHNWYYVLVSLWTIKLTTTHHSFGNRHVMALFVWTCWNFTNNYSAYINFFLYLGKYIYIATVARQFIQCWPTGWGVEEPPQLPAQQLCKGHNGSKLAMFWH